MNITAKGRRKIRRIKTVSVWVWLLAALLVPTASRPQAPKNDFILYGGDVVTMDKAGTVAEAVWVRNGRIEAVGSREEVMRKAPPATERIDLHGAALLPGFVEPHLHLDLVTLMSFYVDVSPCLPAPYEMRETCPPTLEASLRTLGSQGPPGTGWLVGSGIDPSRTPGPSAALFHKQPAQLIEKYVSKTRPVIILDASGHLAYANLQAFVAAGICKTVDHCSRQNALKPEPTSPGKWDTAPDGSFTGLLVEDQSFVDFDAVLPQPTWKGFVDKAEGFARDKAADFALLDKNPLKQPPNEIHRIRVLSTFVGGSRNDWPKE